MNKKIAVFVCFAAAVSIDIYADLGLNQLLASGGPKAVGAAVKNAATIAYSSGDQVETVSQLAAALDEAIQTGHTNAVRYAIIAIMMAGGVDHLEISKKVINNRLMFTDYQQMGLQLIAEASALMTGNAVQKTGKSGSPAMPMTAVEKAERAVKAAQNALETTKQSGNAAMIQVAENAVKEAEAAAAKTASRTGDEKAK